jgi:hypothetical protein
MYYLPHCLLRSACPRRNEAIRRGIPATGTFLILVAGLGLTGCNNYPAGIVPVSGKLTLDGGAWPKSGKITFSPLKPLPGHPALPAVAPISDDGSFTIKTSIAPGLVPGEYGVAIACWKEAPDEHHAGKSAIAERYHSPRTSGLTVKIPEGSGPVVLSGKDWDIKSK